MVGLFFRELVGGARCTRASVVESPSHELRLVEWPVGKARCAKCNSAIDSGTHCAACAGNASTMIASSAATAVATPAAKAVRKHGDPLIGVEVIGQYVIRSKLGKGGMGAVYLADQKSVGRRAVIKVLHPALSRDPEIQSRFETEARAACQLNHPNIVTVFNYGAMDDGTLFLAMEHLDGETLAEAAAKRLPLPRVVNIVSQIASALGEAHRRGVVHRDVKPTNIMLVSRDEQDDFVKVLDFGIAHIDGTRVTATGDICGTPTYMSPEQIRGKAVDGRSDLYSLGCMLFELLTGKVPFEGGNTIALAYMHTHEDPPRPSSVAPKANIPLALDAFVARALAKNPADRPRDAAAFRDELCAAVAPEAEKATAAKQPASIEVAPAKPSTVSRPATRPRIKADSKPLVKRSAQDAGLFRRAIAAMRAPFRRRKSFAQRVATRVRMFGTRNRRPRLRWLWITLAGLVAVSLIGVGWYVMTHPKGPTQARSHPPTKPSRTNKATGSKTNR
jgi:serine/threonine protein kinase